MANRTLNVAIVLAATIATFALIIGCDDATGPGTEFGHAELIYELISDDMYNIRLADVSLDGDMYILRTYNYETKERGLWYLEPAEGEPFVIGEDTTSWWGSPKLSPDKENVVYQEKSGIYVVPVAGGEPRRIYGQGLDPTATQWLDDDTVLMYVLEGRWDINTIDVNTLEVNTLLTVVEADVWFTYLSPDGKHLFVGGDAPEPGNPDDYYHLFRIYDTETWEYEEYIIGEDGIDYVPSGPWSPDGTKIAISAMSKQRTYLGYFDLATSDEKMFFSSYKLLFNGLYKAIWSPDGRHFLASEERDDNILRVFAVDVE